MELLPTGLVKQDTVARTPLRLLRLPPGTTLTQLQQHGVVFSHAPVICAFDPMIDPLTDLLARRESHERIDVDLVLLPTPVLSGYNRHGRHWEHALLFVSHEQWPLVQSHMCSVRFKAPDSAGLYIVTEAAKMITDPLSGGKETVTVSLFVVTPPGVSDG